MFASGVRAGSGQVSILYTTTATPGTPVTPATPATPATPGTPVPAPVAAVARKDLAGARVRAAGTPAIYLIDDDGTLRHIPDPTTYDNLFRDWNGVQDVDVSKIASGPALSSGAYLAIAQETMSRVYLVDNNQKRWITSPAVMDKFYFNWGRVVPVPQSTLDALPTGPAID